MGTRLEYLFYCIVQSAKMGPFVKTIERKRMMTLYLMVSHATWHPVRQRNDISGGRRTVWFCDRPLPP